MKYEREWPCSFYGIAHVNAVWQAKSMSMNRTNLFNISIVQTNKHSFQKVDRKKTDDSVINES